MKDRVNPCKPSYSKQSVHSRLRKIQVIIVDHIKDKGRRVEREDPILDEGNEHSLSNISEDR